MAFMTFLKVAMRTVAPVKFRDSNSSRCRERVGPSQEPDLVESSRTARAWEGRGEEIHVRLVGPCGH